MKHRTVLMYSEIGCFLACVTGWIMVCSTLVIQYWSYTEVGTTVITSNLMVSNLWKDCMTDTTGMTDCKGFPSLLALQLYIHMCRALIFTSIVLGFLAHVLALVGMKCTKLGGSDVTNAKVTFAAGMTYFAAGFCAVYSYSWYGYRIISEFLDPTVQTKKFELGVGLYIGWGGSALLMTGGFVYSILTGRESCKSSPKDQETLACSPEEALTSEVMEPSKEDDEQPPSPAPEPENEKTESISEPLAKAYSKGEYV